MKKTFKVKEKCPSCNGTGIYVGLGEKDGAGVVCSACKGTGCHEFIHTYEDFKERVLREDVKLVLQTNPGISVGEGDKCTLKDFGGIGYQEWLEHGEFPKGSEMRKYSCPSWWYQCANYDLKPKWSECIFGGTFSSCRYFSSKELCWKKFDEENI